MIRCAATSKPGRVEDLAADVRVQPAQVKPLLLRQNEFHRLAGLTAGQRQPELLVLVRGRDVLVGVRLHADRHPQQHRHATAVPLPRGGHPADLVDAVDDHPADPGGHGAVDLRVALVVAVQADSLWRHTSPQRHRELATTAGVHGQPVLGHPASDRRAQERLAGVVDVGVAAERPPERIAIGHRPPAQVGLVQHVRRGAVLARDVADVHAADPQRAVVTAPDRRSPQPRDQVVDVLGHLQPPRPADAGVHLAGDVRGHALHPVRSRNPKQAKAVRDAPVRSPG